MTAEAYTMLVEALHRTVDPIGQVGNGFYLRDGDTYSVLGVLCEITEVTIDKRKPNAIDKPTTAEKPYVGVWTFDGEICVLPESVAAWAGITDRGFRLSRAFESGSIDDYERL